MLTWLGELKWYLSQTLNHSIIMPPVIFCSLKLTVNSFTSWVTSNNGSVEFSSTNWLRLLYLNSTVQNIWCHLALHQIHWSLFSKSRLNPTNSQYDIIKDESYLSQYLYEHLISYKLKCEYGYSARMHNY